MAFGQAVGPGNPQRHQEYLKQIWHWRPETSGIFGPDMALTAPLATLDFERQVPAAAGKKKVQPEWSQIWGTNGI